MLPLFPLANVVLFPGAYLPLHIFEPRYRAMVRDALACDGMIGMVVPRPGPSAVTDVPAVYATGCAGTIVHHEALADGRYNIVLRGVRKFSIRRERLTQPYREADVEWLDEPLDEAMRAELRRLRRRLDALLMPAVARGDAQLPADMADDEFVNAVSQALDLDIIEKLSLLEKPDAVTRATVLVERLERLLLEQGSSDGPAH